MKPTVLIVDDEPNIRKMLRGVLEDEGFACEDAIDVAGAREKLGEEAIDAILLDVNLPGEDGLALLSDEELPPVLMMSGHGNIDTALRAVRLGAVDFLEKPLAVERLLVSLHNALERRRLETENLRLRETAAVQELLGDSRELAELRSAIEHAAPADSRVLITGENGTGKELVARALHRLSPRRAEAFIKVNCAAIPSELLESELFGHEKGAFTGAIRMRRGKFELAQRGTLLLDEIGDMNPTTQAKLLRVLEENELERVGAERSIQLDVRVLAATNQNLEKLMDEGRFRRDLYFRLCVIPIHVPALREHADDIPLLAAHYLEHFAQENGAARPSLSTDAVDALLSHPWPGNVRELRNLMERLLIMSRGAEIRASDLHGLLAAGSPAATARPGDTLSERLERFERESIEAALDQSGGNAAEAARSLGLDRANLHRKMKRLGIEKE